MQLYESFPAHGPVVSYSVPVVRFFFCHVIAENRTNYRQSSGQDRPGGFLRPAISLLKQVRGL